MTGHPPPRVSTQIHRLFICRLLLYYYVRGPSMPLFKKKKPVMLVILISGRKEGVLRSGIILIRLNDHPFRIPDVRDFSAEQPTASVAQPIRR